MSDKKEIPVFLINGFMDAGKTSFLSYTIGEAYFHIEENTLLIVCEDGTEDYEEHLLVRKHVTKVSVSDIDELSESRLMYLAKECSAERVLIEYNGMWGDPGLIKLPDHWVLFQQITIIDGTTLGLYLRNMRQIMGPMLRNTELCIVNRCDGLDKRTLMDFKKVLRPMLLKDASLIMQNRYGEIMLPTNDEDLPYDVTGNEIIVKPEDYLIWFFDVRDYPERYAGKRIRLTAQIRKNEFYGKNVFAIGRLSMICCENDITFLGMLASYEGLSAFQDGSWVSLEASVVCKERSEYGGMGPFLLAEHITDAEPILQPARV